MSNDKDVENAGTELERIPVDERKRLAELEDQIERAVYDAYVSYGDALSEINEGRLYRSDYTSFETYARERWNLSTSHAYRLMAAAKVAHRLREAGIEELPTESQARLLGSPTVKDPVKVWQKMIENGDRTIEGRPKVGHYQLAQACGIRRRQPSIDEAHMALVGREAKKAPVSDLDKSISLFKSMRAAALVTLDAARELQTTKAGRDFLDEVDAVNTLLDLVSALENRRPTGPCPQCLGGGCPRCGNLGYRRKMRVVV